MSRAVGGLPVSLGSAGEESALSVAGDVPGAISVNVAVAVAGDGNDGGWTNVGPEAPKQ